MEYKYVRYKRLKKGMEIKGTKDGSRTSLFTAYVKDINPSFVTVNMWRKDGTEEKLSTHMEFALEMTEEDIKVKYFEKAKEVVANIQNKLYKDQIGYHEMWNSWLFGTPFEIAQACSRENIKIVGYCDDIVVKHNLFSSAAMDIGVCAEYEDGERFWCHFSRELVSDLMEMAQLAGLIDDKGANNNESDNI